MTDATDIGTEPERYFVEITDVTGATWVGDAKEMTADELEQAHTLLKEFHALDTLTLPMKGGERHFNPAHLVSLSVRRSTPPVRWGA